MNEVKDEFENVSYWARMKESLSVYQWVFQNTVPDRSKKHFMRMLIPMFFYEAFGMAIPLAFGFIVNAVILKDSKQVTILFVGIIVLMILRLVLHRLYMNEREYIKGYNEAALINFITTRLFEKSIGQHVKNSEELSQSSMNRARGAIRFLTSLMLFEGITSVYSLTLSFCFIWFLAPFAGIVLTIAFVLYIFGSLLMNKDVIEKFGPIDEDFKQHNDRLEESWDKAIRVLSLGKGADFANILSGQYEEINNRSRKFWIGFINKITIKDLVNVCALVLVWGFYVYSALESKDSSQLVGFLVPLFSWSWSVVNNIWRIGHIEQEFNWCLPTVKKLKTALEIEPDIIDNNPEVFSFEKTPMIEFKNLTFNHVKNDSVKATIKDISFTIMPGEKVALIGASGAGKTTIAKLLQRAYDPHEGNILVDGVDLRKVAIKAWRGAVGEISQQIDIFDGTLRDNLLITIDSFEHGKYSDEVLGQTMNRFVIDFCSHEGLNTRLGKDGIHLSGGQQQRVAIAQVALKKEARIYIIDEATSSLDATTEKLVQKGFEELLSGEKSALIVAHKLATVRNICTKFIVLKSLTELTEGESQIEAMGNSFEEIYSISPTLRRLMADQDLSLEKKNIVLV